MTTQLEMVDHSAANNSVPNNSVSSELAALSTSRRALFEILYQEHIGDLPLMQAPLIARSWPEPLPIAPNQQRLYLIQSARPTVPLFNNPFMATLEGSLDLAALQQSLDYFAARHEALRYQFQTRQGIPTVLVQQNFIVPLTVIDLQEVPPLQQDASAEQHATTEALQPFDLAHGPLIRVLLLRYSNRRSKLMVNVHHIVSDGFSGAIFQREFPQIYATLAAGAQPQLPQPDYPYRAYAIWQRQWQRGLAAQRQVAFWQQQLAGFASQARLPRSYACQRRSTYAGKMLSLPVPRATMQAISGAARAQRTSLFVYCLAAFKSLVRELTGNDDILVGTPQAGRIRPELATIYGYLVNKQVLRTNLAQAADFAEILARVKATFGNAFEHQDASILALLRLLCPERLSDPAPLYQMVFTVSDLSNEEAMHDAATGSLAFTEMRAFAPPMAEFELNVAIHPEHDDYRMYFLYSTELFAESLVQGWMTRYAAILTELAATAA